MHVVEDYKIVGQNSKIRSGISTVENVYEDRDEVWFSGWTAPEKERVIKKVKRHKWEVSYISVSVLQRKESVICTLKDEWICEVGSVQKSLGTTNLFIIFPECGEKKSIKNDRSVTVSVLKSHISNSNRFLLE